jgi:hypothetical protein
LTIEGKAAANAVSTARSASVTTVPSCFFSAATLRKRGINSLADTSRTRREVGSTNDESANPSIDGGIDGILAGGGVVR